MEQAPKGWPAQARALPRRGLTRAIAQVNQIFKGVKKRYGPRYTQAMLVVGFLACFLPIPGSTLVGIAILVVIAEGHRGISRRAAFSRGGRRFARGGEGEYAPLGGGPVAIVTRLEDTAGT